MAKKKARKVRTVTAKVCEPRAKLSDMDVATIMVGSQCAWNTVRRWASGLPVQPVSASRIIKAARAAGIDVRA